MLFILFVLELAVIVSWWWYYKKFTKTKVTRQEKGILTGQLISWLFIYMLVPMWIMSIFFFGYRPLFSIFGINFPVSLIGLIICLPFVFYIAVSAIINK